MQNVWSGVVLNQESYKKLERNPGGRGRELGGNISQDGLLCVTVTVPTPLAPRLKYIVQV